MEKMSVRSVTLSMLLLIAPFTAIGDTPTIVDPSLSKEGFLESVTTFASKQKNLFAFLTFASVPFCVWAYQRYKEDCKPLDQLIDESLLIQNKAENSTFLKDYQEITNADNTWDAIEEAVARYSTIKSFSFLIYAEDLETLIGSIAWKLNAISRRSTENQQLIQVNATLTSLKDELIDLLELIKDHDEYIKQANLHRDLD